MKQSIEAKIQNADSVFDPFLVTECLKFRFSGKNAISKIGQLLRNKARGHEITVRPEIV